MSRLPEAAHSIVVARASVRLPEAARYTMPDTNNSAVYAAPVASAPALYADWQAAALAGAQWLRRWRLLEAEAAPSAVAGVLPHCLCADCLTGGSVRCERQLAQRQTRAVEAARQRTLFERQRSRSRVEAALRA
jgi:hypothetical protein